MLLSMPKRAILLCLAGLMALAAMSVPASAAPGEDLAVEKRVVQKVFGSRNPSATLKSLSRTDRELFNLSQTHLESKTVESRSGSLAQAPGFKSSVQMQSMVASAAARGGCWYHYNKQDWSDFNVYEGTTWMELHWCSNGKTITSFSLADAGGQGSLWADYNGIINKNSKNVGWEVRYYVQFKFDYGFASPTPCMQTRGGATGLYWDPRKPVI
jgi:hypothetical protein